MDHFAYSQESTELFFHRNKKGIFRIVLMANKAVSDKDKSLVNFFQRFQDQLIDQKARIKIVNNRLVLESMTEKQIVDLEIDQENARDLTEFFNKQNKKFIDQIEVNGKRGFYIEFIKN